VKNHIFIDSFFDDLLEALKKWDLHIRHNFLDSIYLSTFYKDYWKGIATWSVTEPILKFLIYCELCKKYKIRPEDHAYQKNEMLDFSLFIESDDHNSISEIAIEFKWASFTKKGLLRSSGLESLIADFNKMKQLKNQHKYIIQFSVNETNQAISMDSINKQLQLTYDNRIFRKTKPHLIKIGSFQTLSPQEEMKDFTILLWVLHEADSFE
jgi:hypothetical protein